MARLLKFEFETLLKLLGRSVNDTETANVFGQALSDIKRDEYYGSLEFKSEGIGVVFQEAPWVIPLEQVRDPKELYLAAFHLHRSGHEGFEGYSGRLPNALAFGDSKAEVLRKLGQPVRTGGGGVSRLLKGVVPRWFWYPLDEAILHTQFDPENRVNMITLRVAEITPAQKAG